VVESTDMKVIDSLWFNTFHGSFGFVIGENKRGERKLYAGVVSGLNREVNEQTILDYGSRVNISMMEGLIAKVREGGKND